MQRDRGELVGFESSLLEGPPSNSHYMVWVKGRESEPLSVYFEPGAYTHGMCEECHNDKCWIAEDICLVEFMVTHPDNLVYEHACCCACHDTGECDEEEDDPAYRPTQAA